ncbi:hypothetical protein Cgig2_018901 [Carnegiea gigantea]|uniref:Glycoside hydrolase family 3 C-terminal domain-containing protein n=1 Tax=Carnegiea gigantea TaxID=171969 RepID=A0A9Q1JH59_9CARY|nr:hypothetical protein Cgig2_018901 [Carnegiea gigantea]
MKNLEVACDRPLEVIDAFLHHIWKTMDVKKVVLARNKDKSRVPTINDPSVSVIGCEEVKPLTCQKSSFTKIVPIDSAIKRQIKGNVITCPTINDPCVAVNGCEEAKPFTCQKSSYTKIVPIDSTMRPLILVLTGGGPVDVSFAKGDPKIASILWAGYPGKGGGKSLAQVIFGDYNTDYPNPTSDPIGVDEGVELLPVKRNEEDETREEVDEVGQGQPS